MKYVMCIQRYRKNVRNTIYDREWDGLDCEHLYRLLKSIDEQIEKGEKWHVLF